MKLSAYGLTFDPFRLLLICLAGWLNQQQQDAYLGAQICLADVSSKQD